MRMTEKNYPLTKITRPSLPEILPRARLFNILSGPGQRPVTWICGPGGSGKTCLVASYLDAHHLPCLWYQMDAGDADAASFFYYMRLAAKKAAPRFRKPLPLLTPEYRRGLAVFSRRFFEELFRRLKPPCVIVLDNYHLVPREAELHAVMNEALHCLPEGIRVVVMSRHRPPAALIGWRAGDRMALIGWDEIRFSLEESRSLICLKESVQLPEDMLALLHGKTDGWVAGLVLLIKSMAVKTLDNDHLAGLTPREIFDYFAAEVLAALDNETRDFLLITACLPKMTAATAAGLTGRPEADAILADLHGNHFFTERHFGSEPVYQYHPLFREFLLARMQASIPPQEAIGIQKRAAALLSASGDIENAAGLLIAAQDWPALARLVQDHAQAYIVQGRNKTLEDWLAHIPSEILEQHPWLLYWSGVCRIAFNPAGSREHFEKAFNLFEKQGQPSGALMAWSGVVQTYIFVCDDFKPLDRWIAWLDDFTRDGFVCPSAEIKAAVAAGMIGALEWRMPAHPRVRSWVNDALSLSQACPHTDTYLRAFTNCALYYTWVGDFAECRILIEEMRKISRTRPASPFRLILFKLLEAILYNSCADDTGRAAQVIAEGLEIAGRTGVHVIDHHLYGEAVCNALNENDVEKGRALFAQMEGALGLGGRTHTSHYYYFAAWHQLLSGNVQQAMAYAHNSQRLIEETGVPFSATVIRLLLAHLLHVQGKRAEADQQLARVWDMLPQTGSSYFEYLYYLSAAYFALERGEPTRGRDLLRAAMTRGREKDFATTIYFWLPKALGRLCSEALKADIENDYARMLVRKLNLVPADADEEIKNWPWRFEITTLGTFTLMREGRPLQALGKVQKKPLQMLKTLVALGPGRIQKERLIDALWPEAEGDTGNIAFHTTLSRLRRLLGEDRVIRFNDSALSLDRHYCQVDSWTFERLCDRITALDAPPSTREAYDQAIALYRGAFLPGETGFLPTISVRERLRTKFLRLVCDAGLWLTRCGDCKTAQHYFAKGLEADPLAEELHQGLIGCYFHAGRKAEAMSAYQRCKHLLQSELGVDPSPQTELLKNEIMTK